MALFESHTLGNARVEIHHGGLIRKWKCKVSVGGQHVYSADHFNYPDAFSDGVGCAKAYDEEAAKAASSASFNAWGRQRTKDIQNGAPVRWK